MAHHASQTKVLGLYSHENLLWISKLIHICAWWGTIMIDMLVGPKTRRWWARQEPNAGLFALAESIAEEKGVEAANTFLGRKAQELSSAIKELFSQAQELLSTMEPQMRAEFKRMVAQHLESVPHIKGENGYTPVKDKDYFDGKPGENGYTPKPGVDYFTRQQTEELIGKSMAALFADIDTKGTQMGKKMAEVIRKSVTGEFSFEKIARGIESLPEKEKLDYHRGLKNTPHIPAESAARQRTLHRGGGGVGKETYYYDLSDLCNGSDKSFSVPANTRIVAVVGTDAPGGTYRPVVDWTGSGTTTLNLTSEVAAPQTGATLYILYVV